MRESVGTMVVESRSLVREALVSLMASHAFQVTGSFSSTDEIENSLSAADAPTLVILGALPADKAASAARSLRSRWPAAKIVLLFDHASGADVQILLASELDGCIPLFASPDTLFGTLEQIIGGDLRVLMVKAGKSPTLWPAALQKEGVDELPLSSQLLPLNDDAEIQTIRRTNSLRVIHGLSPREEEILKSVVSGHSNKVIARACGVTDATIKVHMKSILRKIQVANRTQAAVWALERGLGSNPETQSSGPCPSDSIEGA